MYKELGLIRDRASVKSLENTLSAIQNKQNILNLYKYLRDEGMNLVLNAINSLNLSEFISEENGLFKILSKIKQITDVKPEYKDILNFEITRLGEQVQEAPAEIQAEEETRQKLSKQDK